MRISIKTINLLAAICAARLSIGAHAAEIIKPDIGEPLRDAVVTCGPDGIYYLTGTRAMAREWETKPDTTHDPYFITESKPSRKSDGSPDFMYNDGVKVWSSKDLLTWKDEGVIWNLLDLPGDLFDWRARVFAFPDRKIKDRRVRGATTPRLQFFDGVPHLVYSMGGHDVGIMRGKGVKGPFGPQYKQGKNYSWSERYEVTSVGPGYGSVFQDKDGSRYLVWGPGYVVEMTNDLSAEKDGETPLDASKPVLKDKKSRPAMIGPPGKPFDLQSRVKGYPNADWCAQQFAPRAGALFLHQGKYYFTWSAMTDVGGVKREDSFVAVADSLKGSYGEPSLLVEGSGPVWLCDAGEKGIILSCSMNDAPVLIPLEKQGATFAAKGIVLPETIKPELPGKPQMFDYANSKPSGQWHQPHPATKRSKLVPVFDLPLTDICIAKGGDDAYYMTGTAASVSNRNRNRNQQSGNRNRDAAVGSDNDNDFENDFENNDGIYLWRSTDLNTWQPLGKVWDIEKDGGEWQKQHRIPANNPTHTRFARGVTSPEIVFAKETYWIAYSMNGRGTGLLKSRTGKPEGPYEDLGRITTIGGSPSLFVDDDDSAIWLWGNLRAARMRSDWRGIEDQTVSLYLQCAASNLGPFHDPTDQWEHNAPHLFTAMEPKSKQKKYYLTCEAITQRNGRANRETFVAEAAQPLGPYTEPFLMIPHGGQTSIFSGPDNKLYASFFGADTTAVFRDRPGIVPLEFGYRNLPRKINYNFYTHRGPWDSVETPLPHGVADYRLNYLPDGNFYLGTSAHIAGLQNYAGSVPLWQSPDLKKWKVLEKLYTHAQAEQEPGLPAKTKEEQPWEGGRKQISWATGLYFVKDNYYLNTGLTPLRNKQMPCRLILKSESGKAEGPYRFHATLPIEGLFQDDDGAVYGSLNAGTGSILKIAPDLKSVDTSWASPLGKEGQFAPKNIDNTQFANDCGSVLFKVDGKYIIFTLDGYGSYPTRYFWANRIVGPWHELGHTAYSGHGKIARGPDGTWWTAHQFIHEHYNYCAPTEGGKTVFLPLHLDMKSTTPRIEYRFDDEAGVREMSIY